MRHQSLHASRRPRTRRAARVHEFRGARFALTSTGRALLVGAPAVTGIDRIPVAPAMPGWLAALEQLRPGERVALIVHEHGVAAVRSRAGLPLARATPRRGTPAP